MKPNTIFDVQIYDLKIKTDEALFFLYEKNNLIKIDYSSEHINLSIEELDALEEGRYSFFDVINKTYELMTEAEKEILLLSDQSYEINLESVTKLAEKFLYQNFKDNLDNMIERLLFSTYLSITTSKFAIRQSNQQQILHCLCHAYSIYGRFLSIKNRDISSEISKFSISQANASYAKIKAEKIWQEKAPKLKILEEIWDKENWGSKGRGKFSKFAEYIILKDKAPGMSFETIKNHISTYFKNKKSIN